MKQINEKEITELNKTGEEGGNHDMSLDEYYAAEKNRLNIKYQHLEPYVGHFRTKCN